MPERGVWQRRYNKQVLKAYPYPFTCTALQFAVGSVLALTMWTLNLHEKPKVDKDLVSNAPPTCHSWHAGIQRCLCAISLLALGGSMLLHTCMGTSTWCTCPWLPG